MRESLVAKNKRDAERSEKKREKDVYVSVKLRLYSVKKESAEMHADNSTLPNI
jgi:hypothetical protein